MMAGITEKQKNIFHHAREIIKHDQTIPEEDKESIFKLIQALVEVADLGPAKGRNGEESSTTFTREVISRHALMAAVKQQIAELDALQKLSLNIASSLDLQTVLDTVVAEAMRLVKNARAAHIFLHSHGKLEFGASLTEEGVKNTPIAMPRKEGLTATVAASGVPIIVEDITDHPLYKDTPRNWHGSIVGIPLKFNKTIVGVMNLSRSIVGGFTRAELRLIGLLADQAVVAISNANLHKQATDRANTDSVTGLPNRRALDERLQEDIRHARREGTNFTVVMMDLDGFKNVNDTYGHVVGDEILYSLFNHLADNIRPTDFLARYGGDELTLIIRDADLNIAKIVTQKIIDLVGNYDLPIVEDKRTRLGITAGIAVYPVHSKNASDLLRMADAALYQAKKHNRGSYAISKGSTGPLHQITMPRK